MERERLVALVERSQKGDNAALNELITECYEGFYYFALKTVKDENIASDITQESCIEIMTTIDKLHEPAAFIKWSRQIIYHQCTRHFRKRQDVQVEEDEDGYTIFDKLPDESEDSMPEQVYEDKEFRKTIMDLVMSLPEEQRSALLLYYYEKLSVKEIAEIQDVNEGTVKSRLNYGRKAVKKKVEEYEDRTGIKLHGFIPLLLVGLFNGELGELSILPVIPDIASITAGAGAASAAAGGSAAASTAASAATAAATAGAAVASESVGAAAVSFAAESVATTVGKSLVKAVTLSVAAKVIAAILGIVTVGTAVVGGIIWATDNNSGNDSEDHEHEYSEEYFYNEKKHWQVCEDCEERSDKKEHKFEGRACKVCGYMTASQGLYMVEVGYRYEVGGIGTCTDKDVVIPSEYNGKPVTHFNGWAFEGNTTIESIVIPETFTSIGNRVFWRCSSLKKVTLPKSMSYIAEYAFWDCTSLTDIELPEELGTIGHFAFSGCLGFEEFEVSGKVKEIGTGAFYECTNLKKVYLPGTVELISHSAFYQCPNLTDVYFDGTMNQWKKIETDETSFELNGWDKWEDLTFTVHCTDGDLKGMPLPDEGFVEDEHTHQFTNGYNAYDEESHWMLCDCGNYGVLGNVEAHNFVNGVCEACECPKFSFGLEYSEMGGEIGFRIRGVGTCTDKEIVIPAYYKGKPVLEIGPYAFADCVNIEKVHIPDNVIVIGWNAFENTGITEINIPSSVRVIGGSAFRGTKLTEVTIPEGVTELGEFAFWDCQDLTKAVVPSSVQKIERDVFSLCEKLTDVYYPGTVDQFKKIDLPESLCDGALAYTIHCSDGEYNWIWEYEINDDGKTCIITGKTEEHPYLTIPSEIDGYKVIAIGETAFEWDQYLKELIVSEGVTHIGFDICSGSESFEKVILPDSLTYIESNAFAGCGNLMDIYYQGTMEKWQSLTDKPLFAIGHTGVIHCIDGDIVL